MVTVVIDDDVEEAADAMRPMLALYVGGMGAQEANFHFDVFCRLGYEAEATKIQELYLEGRKDEAAAAVPTAMVEEIALVGPREKIRDELEVWKASRVTTMLVNGSPRGPPDGWPSWSSSPTPLVLACRTWHFRTFCRQNSVLRGRGPELVLQHLAARR